MYNKNGYSSLNMRLDENTQKLLEDLEEKTGFSKREILAYSSQPCGPCGTEDVRVKGKNNQIVSIPRGILFNSMLQKHSGYKKKKK